MRRAERMNRLGTETAFEVLAEVKKLEAQGRSIVSFAIGEPDFDTPASIVHAGVAALERGETHYSPSAGIAPLREAIAAYIGKTRSIEVDPDCVVVTPGAKPIIFHGLLATVDPGDEVVYPNPGFPIYESVIGFIGAKPVPLPLVEEREFSFDIDKLRESVSDKTAVIILNSPQNPTGGVLSPADLEVVADLAVKHDITVISDEVYSRIVFDGNFHSISTLPGMQDRTIIIDGFSKTYAMTGWRIGYGVMPKERAADVARLETNSESCTATFTQYAALEALTGPQDSTDRMVASFNRRRDIIVDGLNEIPGFGCLKPGGAFYVFPNVTEACRMLGLSSAKELQQRLLQEAGVAVLPRTSFGTKNSGEDQEYVRLSYATSEDNIRAGLARMKEFIRKAAGGGV